MGQNSREGGQRPRILMDLTTSYLWRGKNAVGIVRTEREIAVRLLNDASLDVLPVIFWGGNLCAIDPEEALKLVSITVPIVSKVSPVSDNKPVGRRRFARNYSILNFAKRLTRKLARSFVDVVPRRAREDVRTSLIHAYRAMHSMKNRTPAAPGQGLPSDSDFNLDFSFVVHPDNDDILFIGGLGWDVIDCRRIGILQAQSGMKIASIVYDLIPTKMPEFLGGQPKDYFRNYFLQMVDLCDHMFCISKTTQSDLAEFCEKEQRICPATSVIYLGADLPSPPSAEEFSVEDIAHLREGRFALSVGTFEVRKNYGFLLTLWEELVKDPSFDLNLVIAGMPGWGTDALMERMQSSPLFGKRIFWFKGLSDRGISWLYENCHVFVFPSLYEGWGLPVIEALQHKKPVIASNRGSVPEAGLGVAKIIDVDRFNEWSTELIRHQRLSQPETIPPVALPSWEETVSSVKSELRALA